MRWTVAGIVTEGQPIEVAGQNLWIHKWVKANEPEVLLPHPQYQQQSHRFVVYEAACGGTVVRFAAAEVSPNVYAFYVPG
jgi:hypothetical protein